MLRQTQLAALTGALFHLAAAILVRLRLCSLPIASDLSLTICERFRFGAIGSKSERCDRD
jgi:hypothetical protein